MLYKIFYNLGKIYTSILKYKFHSFGKNSIIKPLLNSYNEKYISIGENVNIGAFCRITVSTDFAGIKCKSRNNIRLKIGNNVDIGNNSFISANNNVIIGNNIIMSSYVFITDHNHRFDNIEKNLHQQPLTDGGYIKIEDNVFIGVKVCISPNVTVGTHSVIGASSVVTKDVPPYSVVVGNPAKIIKKYDFTLKKWVKIS